MVPRSVPSRALCVEVRSVLSLWGDRDWSRNRDGAGSVHPGRSPRWLAPQCPLPGSLSLLCTAPAPAKTSAVSPTPSLDVSHPAHRPPSYSITVTPENMPEERGKFTEPCEVRHHLRGHLPLTASDLRLTGFRTEKKLFSNSKFVHHACRQLSRWNLGTSQMGPQGARENNPTNKHTEYM